MYYIRCKFGLRKHRGGLKESLETIKYISEDEFKRILPKYEYYAFDERVNQVMFLHKHFMKKVVKYDWLFIQFINVRD